MSPYDRKECDLQELLIERHPQYVSWMRLVTGHSAWDNSGNRAGVKAYIGPTRDVIPSKVNGQGDAVWDEETNWFPGRMSLGDM